MLEELYVVPIFKMANGIGQVILNFSSKIKEPDYEVIMKSIKGKKSLRDLKREDRKIKDDGEKLAKLD